MSVKRKSKTIGSDMGQMAVKNNQEFMDSMRVAAMQWTVDNDLLTTSDSVSDSIINSIVLDVIGRNKDVKTVDFIIFKEEKHIEFYLAVKIRCLLFPWRRKRIISNIYNIMYNLLRGWNFNVKFSRKTQELENQAETA